MTKENEMRVLRARQGKQEAQITAAGSGSGGGGSKARRVLTVAVAGFFVTASLPTVAGAAAAAKDVIVSNSDSDPVPTKAMGTTNVAGTVEVGNLPTTMQVNGSVGIDPAGNTVNVANLPATQAVSGTVGIDPAANTVSMQAAPAHEIRRQVSDAAWNSWAAGIGYSYFTHAVINPPGGQEMQVRWMSMRVSVPAADCTVRYASVTQLFNHGGAGSLLTAHKVGPREWIASGEVLTPRAYSAVAAVLCPDGVPPTAPVDVDASLAGDLFPAA